MRERLAASVVVQALASLLGLVLALPFAYFMFVEWWGLVRLGGWGAYLIVAWGVCWTLFFAFRVADQNYLLNWLDQLLPWTEMGQLRRHQRDSWEPHA